MLTLNFAQMSIFYNSITVYKYICACVRVYVKFVSVRVLLVASVCVFAILLLRWRFAVLFVYIVLLYFLVLRIRMVCRI